MPRALIMTKENKQEFIFSSRDFEELLDKYIGADAALCYRTQIDELSAYIEELDGYIDDEAVHACTRETLRENGY